MKIQTKILIKLWFSRLIVLFFIGAVVWINIHRLQDNLYANYEKVIDYGRVREIKEKVDPVIAAIFYEDKNLRQNITAYLSHGENYKKHHVRMIVISKLLTPNNEEVIRKLYGEIKKYNAFTKVSLIFTDGDDWQKHQALLQKVTGISDIESLYLSDKNVDSEKKILQRLREQDRLLVFLADISQKDIAEKDDFLLEEALYFAQKNFYHVSVFDVVDTHLARAIDKDYTALFSLMENQETDILVKQKRNLQRYVNNYQEDLFKYFLSNLYNTTGKAVWPKKTPQIYRLFDRGDLYVKLLDAERQEIFGYGRVERNESVLVTLIGIAQKAVRRTDLRNVKYIRIYFLTELKKIKKQYGKSLAEYLQEDDGVLVRYENFYAIVLPEDKPNVPELLVDFLRNKAGVPVNAAESDIEFYKFKTVEIEHEN